MRRLLVAAALGLGLISGGAGLAEAAPAVGAAPPVLADSVMTVQYRHHHHHHRPHYRHHHHHRPYYAPPRHYHHRPHWHHHHHRHHGWRHHPPRYYGWR